MLAQQIEALAADSPVFLGIVRIFSDSGFKFKFTADFGLKACYLAINLTLIVAGEFSQ
mgnify:CR=1 FL=1